MDQKTDNANRDQGKSPSTPPGAKNKPGRWQKPSLDNVSLEIMAQPYIRFT